MDSLRVHVDSSKGRQTLPVTARDRDLLVSEWLRRKHLPLNTRCGQRGLCDGCLVELLDGKLRHARTGEILAHHPSTTGTEPPCVRGCEYRLALDGDVALRIPPRSLLAYAPQVVSDFKLNVPHAHDPLWQQVPVPDAGLTGFQRRRPVRPASSVPPHTVVAGQIATLEYHDDHWAITGLATQPDPEPLGVAVDVGTTTVAVLLVNLRDGQVLASATGFNKQMHLGDDVLTRINLCATDPGMTAQLQQLIVTETLAPLLTEALSRAGRPADRLRCMTIAANTTMLHLVAGENPASIGVAPFTPVFLNHRLLRALDLPFPAPLRDAAFTIHLLPSAAAYVGADLTAGALATGLIYDDGPSLLVDVGTNGEIILKHGEHLYGCATAAGPAFEGAGLTHGVRATEGAIAHVVVGQPPGSARVEKIGTGPPIGLCGTAYIDFLATARATGLLNHRGRFDLTTAHAYAAHVIPWKDYGHAFRVAHGPAKTDIVITEPDIANLLQAKAAIAAGILTLLERVHLRPADIRKVYLAGGFGLHLNRAHAIGCGLLPGFRPDQIEVVGNSSLAGAYLALFDAGALDEMTRIARRMEVIELNLDPDFEDRYIEQLNLPEPSPPA
ncbi:MAG: ASKHA domain-containing protein [Verrucomicrobiae bacterium]|nr:ASKHA domain-containing protein [Verrucomicrobiae bacterium]